MTKERWSAMFAERLKIMMLLRNITQEELAKMSRISQFAIWGYLTGQHVPSAYNAVKIARALDVKVEHLIDGIAI